MVVDYGYYGGQCGFIVAFIVLDTQMETFMDTRKGSEKFMFKNTFFKLMIFQVDLAKADTLLIEDEYKKDYKRYYVEKVYIYHGGSKKFDIPVPDPNGGATYKIVHKLRLFFCKKETYLWDESLKSFYLLKGLDHNVPIDQFYQQMALSKEQQELRRLVYGPNDIIVPNNSIGYLLITEVLNPFYIFQVASVILWTSDEYYYYAAAIVLMSVSGIVSSVYQTKKVCVQSTKKI